MPGYYPGNVRLHTNVKVHINWNKCVNYPQYVFLGKLSTANILICPKIERFFSKVRNIFLLIGKTL